jgi:hypothetical protein
VIPSLNKAFADAGSAAVVLRIDSPGGSPVQAGIIVDEILRLKKLYPNKPLYVVVDEICASGGYYIAAAADKIYRQQGQHRRLGRRADGRLRLHRPDGQAGRRTAPADGGREQGLPRPVQPADGTSRSSMPCRC